MTKAEEKRQKFKPNTNYLTVSLFYEASNALERNDTSKAIFSIDGRTAVNKETGVELINAHATFVELEDVTGYKWAREYLHGTDHLRVLLKGKWFAKEHSKWIKEIEDRLQSKALDVMREILVDPSASDGARLTAAKYLSEKGWEKSHKAAPATAANNKKPVGRPRKAPLQSERKALSKEQQQLKDDAERIGVNLKLVKK